MLIGRISPSYRFFHGFSVSAALKLYTGVMRFTTATVGSILSKMSSIFLYAMGLSSSVLCLTDVL